MARRLVSLTDDDINLIRDLISKHPESYSKWMKLANKLSASQERIKVSSAKGKGREFQYFICRWVSKLLCIPYDQQDDNCEIHSREMGQRGCDIILRGKARERFPFDIEAKAVKELSIQEAVDQADANADKSAGRFGVVFYRQTSQKPVVIFSLDTFKSLIERYMNSMDIYELRNGLESMGEDIL